MRKIACALFEVVVIGLLLKPRLAQMQVPLVPLGLYTGWDTTHSVFCAMTVKESSETEIVAEVKLTAGILQATCKDCYFAYGSSGGFSKTNSSKNGDSLIHQVGTFYFFKDDPTECLNKMGGSFDIGCNCRWNVYPMNDKILPEMIIDACDSHWELRQ
ncbi:hypothetical protein FOL47_002821 [Perkinsus chesapeaki]|uniref:Uncharacterized protein n=1 Tax=Perkinsus chesapeaki TaxID=330153 RepID=A0A7J6MBL4_PERCH|nr:hypothetical protein FOL47_002821 [Perkinsus chesapeaki]